MSMGETRAEIAKSGQKLINASRKLQIAALSMTLAQTRGKEEGEAGHPP